MVVWQVKNTSEKLCLRKKSTIIEYFCNEWDRHAQSPVWSSLLPPAWICTFIQIFSQFDCCHQILHVVAILADDHTVYWAELWPSCKKSYTPPSPSFHKLVRFYHEKWLVSELMIKPFLTYSNHANQEMLLCIFSDPFLFHTEDTHGALLGSGGVKAHSWPTVFLHFVYIQIFFDK